MNAPASHSSPLLPGSRAAKAGPLQAGSSFPQHAARTACATRHKAHAPAPPVRRVHVIQVRRYESGASQPTLDVIRRLAVALQVSADVLIFGADERGPDGDLRLQFEAISKFASEEKKVIKGLLEGMILKHEAKRWSSAA